MKQYLISAIQVIQPSILLLNLENIVRQNGQMLQPVMTYRLIAMIQYAIQIAILNLLLYLEAGHKEGAFSVQKAKHII